MPRRGCAFPVDFVPRRPTQPGLKVSTRRIRAQAYVRRLDANGQAPGNVNNIDTSRAYYLQQSILSVRTQPKPQRTNMPEATSYDEVAYVDAVFPQTHPDRLATIARLLDIGTPPIETCRVLELGCAAGANLIPMALGLPGATFVGIDLSARQIERGRQTIDRLGLPNIELRHANILDVDAAFGQFDYIVCHGIFSWVPEQVRDKILAVCRDNLVPNGIAYVSYNTLPGWHMMGMVREMMVFHASQFAEPPAKVLQARALLDFLAKSVPETTPYGKTLGQVLGMVRPAADSYLYHEYLEEFNEPIYFREFASSLVRHQLSYLSEADFSAALLSSLPRPIADILRRISTDMVRMEQYMDFVRNRSFRQSLLVHEGVTIKRNIDGTVLKGLHVASAGKFVSAKPSLAQGVTEAFRLSDGPAATPSNAITKAAFQLLSERWPLFVPFDELLAEARARSDGGVGAVSDASSLAQQETLLGNELLQCYAAQILELSTVPPRFCPTPSARPVASPLARLQAERGERVTTLRHVTLRLDDFLLRTVRLCDGARDRDALLDALRVQTAVARAGAQRSAQTVPEERLAKALDESLPRLAKAALFVA
jgi:methyltransferase-like protein